MYLLSSTEWKRGPTIGRGSSAAVYLATTAGGQLFAVKSADDVSDSALLRKEECLISQLCSPFVIKCLGSGVTCEEGKSVFNLFLEYVPGGTLSELVRRQGGCLDESAVRFYTHQLLEGLNYLHCEGIAHCDIKGPNVLIGEDGLKIGDFGCAKWAECSGNSSQFAGTPAYMAPEVARGEEQSFPADIWALGCTVIEMATGTNPWPEMKDPAVALYRVGYTDDVPEFPDWFSDAGKDLLGKCLMKDASERWTAAELLEHPFFKYVEVNSAEFRDKFTGKSPTSTMDQGFWDAVEVSDSSANPTEIALSLISPAVRIRDLIGDSISSNLNFGVWADDEEDWVVVRGDEADKECSTIQRRIEDDEDSVTVSRFDEEGIQNPVAVEDSFYNPFNDDEINIFSVMFSESVYHKLLNLKRILMEICSHSDQILCFLALYLMSAHLSLKDGVVDMT